MKIDTLSLVRKCLENDVETLTKAIKSAVAARDSAPSAMELHHDTERNQNERMVVTLKQQLHELKQKIENLPKNNLQNIGQAGLWSYAKTNLNGNLLKIIIVPEGYGGREIDGIKLVSVTTPLAEKILDDVKRG